MDRADASRIAISDCRYGRMMYLAQDRYMGHAFARYGEYSESEVALWRQLIRPEWIVVDAGANIGAHTVALARLAGHVIAFEPFKFMYHVLCGNVALNGLTNVTAFNYALGAAHRTIKVPFLDYTIDGNFGGLALGGFEQGASVRVVPLDEVCPVVQFIKADVEGMEGDVLKGAERLIRECRPILYVENNPGPGMPALIDQIHAYDYELYWHYAPHFNPENYKECSVEDEPGVVSFNMLGLPKGHHIKVNGLTRIPEGAS
jgi:FkbM family methyltransferase